MLWFDVEIKRYTTKDKDAGEAFELWFDVGIKRYTTGDKYLPLAFRLWFDVGIKRYTTDESEAGLTLRLWFDVGIKRYTTNGIRGSVTTGLWFDVGIPILAGGKALCAKGRLDFQRRKIPPAFSAVTILLISSSPRYMALASEPERISLFWRVTGSCVAPLLRLPAVFLITFLALWLTLPPLLSFSEMFRAVSS